MINGPSTSTTSIGKLVNGDLNSDPGNAAVGVEVSVNTRCLEDQFMVISPAGRSSDVLCGTNTGQHCMHFSSLVYKIPMLF